MIYGTNTFVFHQTPVKGTWHGLKSRNEANLTCMLKCSPMVVKVGTQKLQDKRIVMTNCKSFACGYFFDDDEFRKKVRKFSVKSVPNLRVFFSREAFRNFFFHFYQSWHRIDLWRDKTQKRIKQTQNPSNRFAVGVANGPRLRDRTNLWVVVVCCFGFEWCWCHNEWAVDCRRNLAQRGGAVQDYVTVLSSSFGSPRCWLTSVSRVSLFRIGALI